MDALKKIFPLSFKYTKDGASLAIGIILYIVLGIVVSGLIVLSTFLSVWIPIVGPIIAWVLGVVSSIVGVYVLAGIIIQVLAFCKVLKD